MIEILDVATVIIERVMISTLIDTEPITLYFSTKQEITAGDAIHIEGWDGGSVRGFVLEIQTIVLCIDGTNPFPN